MKPFKIKFEDIEVVAYPEMDKIEGIRAWLETDGNIPDRQFLGLQEAANKKIRELLAPPKLKPSKEFIKDLDSDLDPYYNEELV